MTDEQKVKAKYPDAIACDLVYRAGLKYRIEAGYSNLSDVCNSENEAWANAAERLEARDE